MKKLYIMIALLLPTFLAAQEKAVQVPTCEAGSAFTIKIPVKFPENMTVQYAWYRNDTLVEDSHMLLLGERAIAYTVPTDKAFGSAVYYFKYMLHDKYDGKWTASPKYAVTFFQQQTPDCQMVTVGTVEGSEVAPPNLSCLMSNAGAIAGSEVTPPAPNCQMSNAGVIEGSAVVAPDHSSCLMSSAGAISSE